MVKRLRQIFLWLALGFVALSFVLVLAFRWLPVPYSGMMLERQIEAWQSPRPLHLQQYWQPWERLPDSLKIAVIAAEDQKFVDHWGFDVSAIRAAVQYNAKGKRVRGASTLSQQVAKNLFLWSGRNWIRKGLEVWFTALIELCWTKQRILEVYLNIAEFGNGIFGAEAAARSLFGRAAMNLSPQQASLLAAVLPNPRKRQANHPTAYILQRATWIRRQSQQLGGGEYVRRVERGE
ncbi:Peptidoglycan glycosyltransglycosylase [gamma proteobacterium HdN1]|nr:Peptidoglycan glycosyltransglycosylase [gamma proteobacterium HdN1]